MKVWQLDFELDGYDNLEPINSDHWENLIFDGTSIKSTYIPIVVRTIGDGHLSDAPGFNSTVPVFSKNALDVLQPLIENDVEILPLKCRKGEYYLLNVTRVLDCIDYKQSQFKRFRNSERIMRFTRYSFYKDVLKNADANIFKVTEEPRRKPFVSEDFVTMVRENSLTGFKFNLVWDSSLS